MLRDMLQFVSEFLPKRVIRGGDGGPYLSRFQLLNFGRERGRLWLHRFHRGDEDRELHNHPFAWSGSLVLAGGYEEERLTCGLSRVGVGQEKTWALVEGVDYPVGFYVYGPKVERKFHGPGSINVIHFDTFHRVHLPNGEAWTLFVSGPILRKWGFLDIVTGVYKDSRTFLAEKGLTTDDDGAPRFMPPERTVGGALKGWLRELGTYPLVRWS